MSCHSSCPCREGIGVGSLSLSCVCMCVCENVRDSGSERVRETHVKYGQKETYLGLSRGRLGICGCGMEGLGTWWEGSS